MSAFAGKGREFSDIGFHFCCGIMQWPDRLRVFQGQTLVCVMSDLFHVRCIKLCLTNCSELKEHWNAAAHVYILDLFFTVKSFVHYTWPWSIPKLFKNMNSLHLYPLEANSATQLHIIVQHFLMHYQCARRCVIAVY